MKIKSVSNISITFIDDKSNKVEDKKNKHNINYILIAFYGMKFVFILLYFVAQITYIRHKYFVIFNYVVC
jgi:hypothetical protein